MSRVRLARGGLAFAAFEMLASNTITASTVPSGGGMVSCTPNPVANGGSSTCTATANSGYTFRWFSGDCTSATCTMANLQANKNVVANFYTGNLMTRYRLYLNAFGGLHLWTTDANEKVILSTQQGWVDEGVAGYVLLLP